jgi:hypothetical protein
VGGGVGGGWRRLTTSRLDLYLVAWVFYSHFKFLYFC